MKRHPKKRWRKRLSVPKAQNLLIPEFKAAAGAPMKERRRRDIMSIGTNLANQKTLSLPRRLRGHGVIWGRTGMGKSVLLGEMLKQIAGEASLLLFDPKGTTATELLDTLSAFPQLAEKIVYFDVNDTENIIGYNNFVLRPGTPVVKQVEILMSACLYVWGHKDYSETPRLYRWMSNTIELCIRAGFTWEDAYYILSVADGARRETLLNKAEDLGVTDFLGYEDFQWLRRLKSHQILENQLESSHNRLTAVLRDKHIRTILSQPSCIDFAEIMNGRKIFIGNFSYGRSKEASLLMLKMMLGEVAYLATSPSVRPRDGSVSDCYVVIEEFGEAATRSVGECLHLSRGFGVWFILVAQYLGQIKNFDEDLLESVFTNTDFRAVFGGMAPQNLEDLADLLFLGQYNFKAVKQTKTVYEITQEWVNVKSHHRGWGLNESQSQSVANSTSEARSTGVSHSRSHTRSSSTGQNQQRSLGTTTTQTRGTSQGVTLTKGKSKAHTEAQGTSHTVGKSHATSEGENWSDSWSESESLSQRLPMGNNTGQMLPTSTVNYTAGGSAGGNRSTSVGSSNSVTESEGTSDTQTRSLSLATSKGRSTSLAQGKSQTLSKGRTVTNGLSHTHGQSKSEGVTHTRGQTVTQGQSHGKSAQWGETISPTWITRQTPREEVAAYWSWDEMKRMAMQLLYSLPKAHAVIQYKGVAVPTRIKYVAPVRVSSYVRAWFLRKVRAHPFVLSQAQARANMAVREQWVLSRRAETRAEEGQNVDDIFS